MAEKEKKAILGSSWGRILLFLSVVGPGIITVSVGNDAGGLTTYSQAGAMFGLDLLWIFIPMTVILVMVQEMANRMGVVTGDGLSSLIRERFGVRITFYLMALLLFTNFRTIMAEFAGIAASGQLIGIHPLIMVPVCATTVIFLVLRWDYNSVEKVFLVACLFYVAYIVTAFMVKPDVGEIGRALVTPHFIPSKSYILILLALFGTTIAPWMQFYQQSSVVEKGVTIEQAGYSKADTVIGSVFVNIIAACILIVCAMTLHKSGIAIHTAEEAAVSLSPLAGKWASHLFAFGLWNASMFAACILPLSTAYTVCEALGWERGVDKGYREAPQFYTLYIASIALGALLVLLPGKSFVSVIILSQVINGLLLPVILVFMLILANDRSLMGTHVNSRFYNAACITAVAGLSLISLAYIVSLFIS